RRAMIAAIIRLLCDRFPDTFSRRVPRPLKVGVYADILGALGDAVRPRDLQSALRAYTSNARYLRSLSAGEFRIGLDGKATGTVTPEDEAAARARLGELGKGAAPQAKVPPAKAGPEAPAMRPTAENQKPAAPAVPKRRT